MDRAEAEYYLRRCGEDNLERPSRSDDLHQRARALAAVGVLSPGTAARILAEYDQARILRGLSDARGRAGDGIAQEWKPPLTRSCGQTLQTPWGVITLHFVTIVERETSIEVTMKQNPPGNRRGQPPRGFVHEEAPDLDIVDEQGNAWSSSFQGSNSNREFTGSYSMHGAFDPGATFITVMGQRVELGPSPDDVTVRVDLVDPSLPVAELADRYLRRCLAAPAHHHHHHDGFEGSAGPTAVTTFLECGILPADAPMIDATIEAQERADQAVPGVAPSRPRAGGSRSAAPGSAGVSTRSVGVAVSLPIGVHIAVTDLRAAASSLTVGFQAAVTSAESLVRSLPDCFAMRITDDIGTDVFGRLKGWGGGGGTFRGRMGFSAPLDPAASMLALHVITDRADVRLDIPLRWDGAQ